MIQIVVMDGKKFINSHANFDNRARKLIMQYIEEALDNDQDSIIEISKWVSIPSGGKKIPRRKERK